MSHHKSIFIKYGGDPVYVGYVRMTNEGQVLSVWIDSKVQQQLFHPEVKS